MKISIKATGLDLTPSLNAYIEAKLGGLARFVKQFDLTGQAELWLEVGRTTRHHRHGEVFSAIAGLRLPKKILRVEHYDADVRAAINSLKTKLHLEIEKYKAKHSPRPRHEQRKE